MPLEQQRGRAGDVRRGHARPVELGPTASGTDESTSTPGAVSSGFVRSESGVGPAAEKDAIVAARRRPRATVIALAAEPGEPIVPRPKSSKSFPAAVVTTTPARVAPSTAATTMSRAGSISGSPSERLITSMPSRTAASMPAAISGAFPSSPTSGVGTVSTL